MNTPARQDDVPFAWITALGATGVAILVGWLLVLSAISGGSGSGESNALKSFRYDRHSAQLSGSSTLRFDTHEIPAVVVDWAALPPGEMVQASWLDELSQPVSRRGPARVADLEQQAAFPLIPASGYGVAPGPYTFVLAYYSRGRAGPELARLTIRVEAG